MGGRQRLHEDSANSVDSVHRHASQRGCPKPLQCRCDLRIFLEEAAEPGTPDDRGVRVRGHCRSGRSGAAWARARYRPMVVEVVLVIAGCSALKWPHCSSIEVGPCGWRRVVPGRLGIVVGPSLVVAGLDVTRAASCSGQLRLPIPDVSTSRTRSEYCGASRWRGVTVGIVESAGRTTEVDHDAGTPIES